MKRVSRAPLALRVKDALVDEVVLLQYSDDRRADAAAAKSAGDVSAYAIQNEELSTCGCSKPRLKRWECNFVHLQSFDGHEK